MVWELSAEVPYTGAAKVALNFSVTRKMANQEQRQQRHTKEGKKTEETWRKARSEQHQQHFSIGEKQM